MNEYTIKVRKFDVGEQVRIKEQNKYDGFGGKIHSYDCPLDNYVVELASGKKICASPSEIEPYKNGK